MTGQWLKIVAQKNKILIINIFFATKELIIALTKYFGIDFD